MENSLFTNKGTSIDTKKLLKADSYEELKEKIESRLSRKYSKSKLEYLKGIQAVFEDWEKDKDEIYRELYKRLKFTIETKAKWLERKYSSVRLSFHDFEAELWKITYEAIESYEQAGDIDTEFTLLETLELFWKYRMKDFIRSCLFTRKHSPWYTAASLADNFNEFLPDDSPLPEEQLILNETVTEMFNDSNLTTNERKLLEIIYDKPEGSLRDWGKCLGIDHPETVRRLYNSLKRKLEKFNPY